VLTAIFFLAGCSQPTSSNSSKEERGVTGVSINPDSGIIGIGRTLQLQAVIEPENASNKAVSWSSANDGIATVDQGGMVTGKAVGTVKITVTTAEGQKTAETTITVTEAVSNAVSIKFDLSGAKAIAALDPSDYTASISNPRALMIGTSDSLVKILEDDTLAPLADFSRYGSLPPAAFIAHSPVAGKKDFYIYFNNEIRYWEGNEEVNLGKFWHVKEDGSIVNILRNEAGVSKYIYNYQYQDRDPVIFDAEGNMFFIVSESSEGGNTNVIYRYNPQAAAAEQLTSTRNNLSYQRMVVSPDGALVIAQANDGSSSTYYLRAIPVANPGGYEDIVYSSSSNSVNSFVISRDSRELYFSGSVTRRVGNDTQTEPGFYRVSLENLKTMNPVLVFQNTYYGNVIPNPYEKFPLFSSYWFYDWQEGYRQWDGSPDSDKIMGWFYDSAASINIEFRYNDKKDKEALASLTNVQRKALFFSDDYNTRGVTDVLEKYWFRKGTDTPVTFEGYVSHYMSELLNYNGTKFIWRSEFYSGDTVDYEKIMEFIYKAANSRDFEFRYNSKTDAAALASLSDSQMTDLFGGSGWQSKSVQDFLTQFCYLKGTDRKVTSIPGSNNRYLSQLLYCSTDIADNVLWWAPEYLDAEHAPDTGKIMAYLRNIAYSDNIEFRYNDKTDADALMSMTGLGEFINYSYDPDTHSWIHPWLARCFRKGTDTPVSAYINPYVSYSGYFHSFAKLMIMADGTLMGLNNSMYSNNNRSMFCQLLDAGGKRDFYIPDFFINSPVIIKTILAADPYIVYSAKLVNEASGQESAFSKIYRVSSADVVDDMFRYIDRNGDRIELDTFSVGADYLYFSGSQGTSMLSAKIDVNSLRYTEMDFGRRLKLVMSY
jgi:hypothetical protein